MGLSNETLVHILSQLPSISLQFDISQINDRWEDCSDYILKKQGSQFHNKLVNNGGIDKYHLRFVLNDLLNLSGSWSILNIKGPSPTSYDCLDTFTDVYKFNNKHEDECNMDDIREFIREYTKDSGILNPMEYTRVHHQHKASDNNDHSIIIGKTKNGYNFFIKHRFLSSSQDYKCIDEFDINTTGTLIYSKNDQWFISFLRNRYKQPSQSTDYNKITKKRVRRRRVVPIKKRKQIKLNKK